MLLSILGGTPVHIYCKENKSMSISISRRRQKMEGNKINVTIYLRGYPCLHIFEHKKVDAEILEGGASVQLNWNKLNFNADLRGQKLEQK